MEKLVGMLHLCRKAGKLHLGQKAVVSLASGNHAPLIILSSDAGYSLKRKFGESRSITLGWSSDKLGEIFGREKLSVLGINDDRFASEIERIVKNMKSAAV